jgi:hypothetical protein
MTISLLFPSRKRAHRAAELCRSVYATAAKQLKVEVLVRIDVDDDYESYRKVTKQYHGFCLAVGPRPVTLSGAYNELFAHSWGDIIGYLADDCVFETPGWDEIIREHFRQRPISLLSDSHTPDDPNNNAMHGFVSRKACEALGYLLPGYFEHGFADRWMLDIYKRAGAPVVFTNRYSVVHRHWHGEPQLLDDTYRTRSLEKDANGRTCDDRDRIVFDSKEPERIADAEKLKKLLK